MKYSIDKASGKKAYMQLYDQLKYDITEGIFTFGSKLPSKRMLSDETGVSVITVEHAYALLCDEGYAEARERSGYYVIFKNSDFFMSSSPPPFSPPAMNDLDRRTASSTISFPILAKAMRKVLLDYGDSILVKSPNHGCSELRSAIASYLAKSQGIYVTPEQIIIGSGAEYLYSLIAQLLSDRRFAVEDPSYEKIRRVYDVCNIGYDVLHLGADGIYTDELNRSTATVLHITPFNSFPSGVTAPASKRAEYLQWATARQGYIIEDNYESELTVSAKNENTIFSLSQDGRVIYVNTFTKTISPSLRVGYMVLPTRLTELFENKLGFYSCTVPLFEQYVIAELICNGDFERHINRVRRKKRQMTASE